MRDFKTSIDKGRKPRPKSRLEIAKENKLKRKSGAKAYKVSGTGKRKLFKGKLGRKAKKILLVILFVLLISLTVGGIRVMAYLQELNDNLPTPDKVFPDLPVASEIYDRKGLTEGETSTTLYRLFDQYNSDPVDIDSIPDSVKWSFLAAEDSDFYVHGGFDVSGLLRCGLLYIRGADTICGGSTVTQQLVKITALTNEVKLERKIKEILLATKVEQLYDKDTILEMYLRVAPFGSNIYGVKTAANFYFGKEPKDLTLAQATLLGAIIQDPIRLSPTLSSDKKEYFCRLLDGTIVDEANVVKNEDGSMTENGNEIVSGQRVKCRQLYILHQMELKMQQINDQTRKNKDDMEMEDVLTQELIDEAKAEVLEYRPPIFDKKAGHFVDYVLDALQTRNYKNGEEPFTVEDLQKGGYKIYTTLDYAVQQVAENYVAKGAADGKQYNMYNAAVMTVTPNNGEIITMAGSRSFYEKSEGCDENGQNCKFDPQTNLFTSPQSPGSSNKPLGYYMAYRDGKLFPGSLLPDIPMESIDASNYSPKNWDGSYTGLNSTSHMLRESRNLPAINVIEMVGVGEYINTARDWGYTSYADPSQYGASIILGGADVYPDEHVQAFTVFANQGDLVTLNPILKIVDKNGEVVYEATPERKSVGDPQATYLLNQSLKDLSVIDIGFDGREYAAKTGTSEDSRDAWTMMWSPDFVTLAWGGNNNNEPMSQTAGYPYYVIFPWLQDYMRDIGGASYFSARTPFTRPGFVYFGGGGEDCNDEGCLGFSQGWLIEGKTPPRDIVKKSVVVCTDQPTKVARPIDISMGLSESREFTYYKNPVAKWQNYLDKYIQEKENRPNVIPTEPCDIDRSGGANGPFFGFTSVSGSTNSINIKGGIYTNTSGGSITSTTFYLDNKVIPSCTPNNYGSFDITCNISSLNIPDNGRYSFKATATDTSGKTNTSNTITAVIGSETTSSFNFITPPFGSGVLGIYNVDVQFTGGYGLNNLALYMIKNNGAPVNLGSMSPIGGNKYRLTWNSNSYGAGTYKFYVQGNVQSSTGVVKSNNSPEANLN